jgi:sugar lactone lactonase YvrE
MAVRPSTGDIWITTNGLRVNGSNDDVDGTIFIVSAEGELSSYPDGSTGYLHDLPSDLRTQASFTFGPDDSYLFILDADTSDVWKYDVTGGGGISLYSTGNQDTANSLTFGPTNAVYYIGSQSKYLYSVPWHESGDVPATLIGKYNVLHHMRQPLGL